MAHHGRNVPVGSAPAGNLARHRNQRETCDDKPFRSPDDCITMNQVHYKPYEIYESSNEFPQLSIDEQRVSRNLLCLMVKSCVHLITSSWPTSPLLLPSCLLVTRTYHFPVVRSQSVNQRFLRAKLEREWLLCRSAVVILENTESIAPVVLHRSYSSTPE